MKRSLERQPQRLCVHPPEIALDDFPSHCGSPSRRVLGCDDHFVAIATFLHPSAYDLLRLAVLIVARCVDEIAAPGGGSQPQLRRYGVATKALTDCRNSPAWQYSTSHRNRLAILPMRCLNIWSAYTIPDAPRVENRPNPMPPRHSGLTLTPAFGASWRWYPSRLGGFSRGTKVLAMVARSDLQTMARRTNISLLDYTNPQHI